MDAKTLIAFRKGRGWSQADLATRLGVNQSQVSRWEAAGSVPGPTAMFLAQVVEGKAHLPEPSATPSRSEEAA